MEVVVTAAAIGRAKLQSNHFHQQTNTKSFYRPDALPVDSVKARPLIPQNTYCWH